MAFGFVLVAVVWLFVFGLFCCVLGVFLCFIPHHHDVFPFLTTMTWAHRPHGVRTRAKKMHLLLFHVLSGHEPDLLGFCGWFGFVLVLCCWVVGVLVLLVPLLPLVRLISSHPSCEFITVTCASRPPISKLQ